MPFATTNDITTYYETCGGGAPLVLLHNDALSLGIWQRLLPHLAVSCRLIAYDRRGHGQSETPKLGLRGPEVRSDAGGVAGRFGGN